MPKKRVKKASSKKKKPRKLSAYNKFVKKKLDSGKTMEEAAKDWGRKKAGLKPIKKKSVKSMHSGLEGALVSNLIELQKIHIGLAEKFDKLSKELSSLLALFEVTARTFSKNVPKGGEYEKDKDFLEKIDRLLDQNKTLAKGLTMIEERFRERVYGGSAPHQNLHEPGLETPKEQPAKPITAEKRPLPRF